ncbi:rod-binding protein [Novosphingobium sp. PS1R-30]|uniref:Rod-binding protein n=1 Tax=Novosphingobium anseongense TaxID=3133436 RepID=A0ABU8RXW6_9SPHN|nr:MAG: flagellar biosynthesis protein FlgJ [Novosphingobium sp.]
MTTISTPTIASTTASATTAGAADSGKLTGVAKQFEAIFIRQMLAAARKTSFGGEDSLMGGKGMDTFRQMQDERFADIASDTGAFGLGKMIETHLARLLGNDEAAKTADATNTADSADTAVKQGA